MSARGRRHYVFDVALSRGKHRTVGGGLPAMNDDAIFLTFRVGCIAGKPPPTKRVQSADYVLFDKSGLVRESWYIRRRCSV
ncbi:hypothetical protein V2I68_06550 [Pseudomonas viridiflava]|uniref:Uncharacterized protein n=1 Tax=Pseudomonas viridiflava TaxID=33069 RepID=A0ABU7N635_PSEVI|nr:hypothetical protein [Pseudomonas viridiflava]MEE3935210.1 hypothetical protein [Pseudomonas viridiflava]MEE4040291.1 hypothetical protein [Pseudomonas viridiflava]